MNTYTSRYGGRIQVVALNYSDGNLAVQLYKVEDGEQFATLSVNLPRYAHYLRAGEFFAKTYSENAEIAQEALDAGVVKDTGGRVETPLGTTPIWRCR